MLVSARYSWFPHYGTYKNTGKLNIHVYKKFSVANHLDWHFQRIFFFYNFQQSRYKNCIWWKIVYMINTNWEISVKNLTHIHYLHQVKNNQDLQINKVPGNQYKKCPWQPWFSPQIHTKLRIFVKDLNCIICTNI
jgi:hypothetical protein